MLRFIDLTDPYWVDTNYGLPLCAFLCTTSNTFVETLDGEHVFSTQDEINEQPQADRLRSLMPANFF